MPNLQAQMRAAEATQIQSVLQRAGLQCAEVQGEGDCLFLALLHQRHQHGVPRSAEARVGLPRETLGMRQLVARHMLARPDQYAAFIAEEDILPGAVPPLEAVLLPPPAAVPHYGTTAAGASASLGGALAAAADDDAAARTLGAPAIAAVDSCVMPHGDVKGLAFAAHGDEYAVLRRYCARMAVNCDQWGGALELQAAAEVHDVAVQVVTRHGVETINGDAPVGPAGVPVTWTLVLWELQHESGPHYTSTIPARDGRTGDSSRSGSSNVSGAVSPAAPGAASGIASGADSRTGCCARDAAVRV
jgi:hypothetical protein